MLDGVHAGQDRAAHALVRFRMGGDLAAEVMGLGDGGGQFLLREGGQGLSVRPDLVVGIELDPVRTGGGLVADGGDDPLDAGGFLRALRQFGDGIVPPRRTIGPGRHDGPGHHVQSRSGGDTGLDGVLQRHVGIAGAFGSEVPQGREAGLQGVPGVVAGGEDPIGQGLLQHLIVPERLAVGVQEQVGVDVHQAGQQGRPRQPQGPGPAGRNNVRAHRADGLPLHQYFPAGVRRPVLGGEHAIRGDEQGLAAGGRGHQCDQQEAESQACRHGLMSSVETSRRSRARTVIA